MVAAIALVVGAPVIYQYVKDERARAEHQRQALRLQQEAKETKAAISELRSKHDAIDDWDKLLSDGQSYRLTPVLSIELERLWKTKRPILFFGTVTNIESAGHDEYHVSVERGYLAPDYNFVTELRLSLRASKAAVDSFLRLHPRVTSADYLDTLRSSVAVVANVTSITASDERGSDGERKKVMTAHGELLELVFVGDVFALKDQPPTDAQSASIPIGITLGFLVLLLVAGTLIWAIWAWARRRPAPDTIPPSTPGTGGTGPDAPA